jgi:predicted amidophosphoribosyltransferase
VATVHEITERLRSTYRTVLPAGEGVCSICHSQPNPGYAICRSCVTTMRAVSRPVRRVVPISLTARDEQLYHTLVHYKRPALPWERDMQQQLRRELAALFGRFVMQHGKCVAGDAGGWDAIVVVPSTRTAPGNVHPLHETLAMLSHSGRMLITPLRTSPEEFGDREASDRRFTVVDAVRRLRILLVDDTMTSGARLQSAASTLTLQGANVVAAVPIARFVNVQYSEELWKRASKVPYDFDRCCLE